MTKRKFQIPLTDLIDLLTITQIKETLLGSEDSQRASQDLATIAADLGALLAQRPVAVSGRVLRLVALLAETNLQVWLNKDRMQSEPERYEALLEYAQELNGLRNHVRNLLMRLLGEWEPSRERATFLSDRADRWYAPLLEDLGRG
jgi:hypothetical protein